MAKEYRVDLGDYVQTLSKNGPMSKNMDNLKGKAQNKEQ